MQSFQALKVWKFESLKVWKFENFENFESLNVSKVWKFEKLTNSWDRRAPSDLLAYHQEKAGPKRTECLALARSAKAKHEESDPLGS